jgi:hypothetical protein
MAIGLSELIPGQTANHLLDMCRLIPVQGEISDEDFLVALRFGLDFCRVNRREMAAAIGYHMVVLDSWAAGTPASPELRAPILKWMVEKIEEMAKAMRSAPHDFAAARPMQTLETVN